MSVEVFHATPPARPYRFELLPEEAMASALELLEQSAGEVSDQLDGAVERGVAGALAYATAQAGEQRQALILLSELSALDFPSMADRLRRQHPRFRSAELCRLLFDKCAEEAHHDFVRARQLSRLALLAAELVDTNGLPEAIWHDIQAEAWAVVADTCRLTLDMQGSQEAFEQAEEHLREGSGTLMVRAEVLIRKASLACDLSRYEEGHRSIDQALCILRAGGLPGDIARALVAKGRLSLESGRLETALSLFEEAVALAEGSTDRALTLAAHHNLAACLCELERFEEAHQPLVVAKSMVKLMARPLGLLRVRWLEGRQAAGRCEATGAEQTEAEQIVAEQAFTKATEGFNTHGLGRESARVRLDLARFYVAHKRFDRLHRVARALFPVLRHGGDVWRRRPVMDRSW